MHSTYLVLLVLLCSHPSHSCSCCVIGCHIVVVVVVVVAVVVDVAIVVVVVIVAAGCCCVVNWWEVDTRLWLILINYL